MKNKLKTKGIKGLASIMAFAMALSGCAGSSSNTGTLRPDPDMQLRLVGSSHILDSGIVAKPWLNIGFVTNKMWRTLFTATAGTLEVEANLAKSYTVSDDGLVYEFAIRDDIVWSDGEAFDIGDIVFSIESLLLSSTTSNVYTLLSTTFSDIIGAERLMSGELDHLDGISVDGDVMTVTLKSPNNLFIQALSQFAILPEHSFEGVDPADLHSDELDYWVNPVVNGMYKVGECILGDSIEFVYNDTYVGEAPYINSLYYRLDFETHEYDYFETNDILSILDFRAESNQSEYNVNGIFYRYFVFNIDRGGDPDPVLSDVRVRQAIAHAIDRETIIKNVYYGTGTVNNTGAVQEYDNPLDIGYDYDPERALELLEEAEYDFDRPITLLYCYSDDTSIKFMEEVAKSLESIGLATELVYGNLYSDEYDYYDIGLKGLASFSVDDWYNEYSSSANLHPNIFGGEPMFDEMIVDLKQANSDEERIAVLNELQELEVDLLYKFPIFIMGHMVYINDYVTLPDDVSFGDSKYMYDLNIENWKVETKK